MPRYKIENGRYFREETEYYQGMTNVAYRYVWKEIPLGEFPIHVITSGKEIDDVIEIRDEEESSSSSK